MAVISNEDTIELPKDGAESCLQPATRAIHADDGLNTSTDVAPALHVSSTFRYPDAAKGLQPLSEREAPQDPTLVPTDAHIYSRLSAPTTTRLEALLSSLLHARALTYSSGLAAYHALLIHLNPRRIAIGAGYHGSHGVISIMSKLTGLQKIDLHGDNAAWDAAGLGEGDVVHVETPLNPTGEAYNLTEYAERAHARGAYLIVDSTFGPPGLQDPFKHGADAVMHSGTKYIGGHSDMLCGVLAVKRDDWWWSLFKERVHLGSVMGSLEGWLGVRSLRTLELRVRRQSANAGLLVARLHAALQQRRKEGDVVEETQDQVAGMDLNSQSSSSNGSSTDTIIPNHDTLIHTHRPPTRQETHLIHRTLHSITHASLQAPSSPWLRSQMPHGYGPVFSILLQTPQMAKSLPSKLNLFHHATSLGGVESLVEWRRMTDPGVDERLVRVSVGVEDAGDLWGDLVGGLEGVLEECAGTGGVGGDGGGEGDGFGVGIDG